MKRKLLISVLLLIAVLTLSACSQVDDTVYTITYHLNGGKSDTINPTAFSATTASFDIYNPTRDGYAFSGWSSSSDLLSPSMNITISTGSTGSRSYYAVWRILPKLDITAYPVYFNVEVVSDSLDWNSNATVILTPIKGIVINDFYWQDSQGNKIIPQSSVWDDAAGHYLVQFFMTRDLDLMLMVNGGAL